MHSRYDQYTPLHHCCITQCLHCVAMENTNVAKTNNNMISGLTPHSSCTCSLLARSCSTSKPVSTQQWPRTHSKFCKNTVCHGHTFTLRKYKWKTLPISFLFESAKPADPRSLETFCYAVSHRLYISFEVRLRGQALPPLLHLCSPYASLHPSQGQRLQSYTLENPERLDGLYCSKGHCTRTVFEYFRNKISDVEICYIYVKLYILSVHITFHLHSMTFVRLWKLQMWIL
jgi:hypothetical protein